MSDGANQTNEEKDETSVIGKKMAGNYGRVCCSLAKELGKLHKCDDRGACLVAAAQLMMVDQMVTQKLMLAGRKPSGVVLPNR